MAIHGTLTEVSGLIDWEILESRGLPSGLLRLSPLSAIESDIRMLAGEPSISFSRQPTILPTFGISLGMLFALMECDRVCRRTARIFRSHPDYKEAEHTLKEAGTKTAGLRIALIEWTNSLVLPAEEQEESLFAGRASVVIARRHFGTRLQ